MEYTVKKLATISGVSARTLRYYDEIGLLVPKRVSSSGYRIYGKDEVDRLQQILFYREMGLSLEDIGEILSSPDFDREKALRDHLLTLLQEKERIELLISNVEATIQAMKGEISMADENKFKGFKKQLIEENEAKYGKEARAKYGDDAVDKSNARIMGLSREKWDEKESLDGKIAALLKDAADGKDVSRELFEAHKAWLSLFWGEGAYSPAAHIVLAETYVSDERFRAYYDGIVPNGAEILKNAICENCK